jgi:hypothetical protein
MTDDGLPFGPPPVEADTGHSRRFYPVLGSVLIAASVLLLGVAIWYDRGQGKDEAATDDGAPTGSEQAGDGDAEPVDTTTAPTTLPPYDGWVNPASVGLPYGDTVGGLITFRGNPTRTYYGEGPVPDHPEVLWRFPESGDMCGESSGKTWCGTGWTGQPSVWENGDQTWVAFGAYDKAVHWLDADTGGRVLADFPVGDIIKGSVTVDPDGYPILYTGSRDNYFRAIAMDRGEPVELWKMSATAVSPTQWNDDWDGSALVLDDYLFEGGENSVFHVVKLNRGYDESGMVTVDPELVFFAPGWDDQQLADLGDDEVSIENSVAISGNTVYFGNSGGLIQGWDITGLADGIDPTRTFRYWVGEDTDASVVVDDEGMLYIGAEFEKNKERAREVGQILKLDPSKPDDPLVWSIKDQDSSPAGVWGTAGLHRDIVIVPTNAGDVHGIDRATGEIRWTKDLPGPTWQSPVIVDDVLVMGDCSGVLHGYDVSDTTVDPPELWSVELGGCIESTPAVWNGRIYVGTRGGAFFALGDP